MYRHKTNLYPARKKSSTPDITLPALHSSKKEWTEINRILCVDQSLNDSGAALFVEGRYIPVTNADGNNVGLANVTV